MRYRTILVEITTEHAVDTSLNVAQALADRFDAVLIGMHVVVPPFVPGAWEGGASVHLGRELVEGQRRAAQALRERVEARFRERCGAGAARRARWREVVGDPAEQLATAARTADLVVVGKGGPDAAGAEALAEHLTVAAGVPVLVLPPGAGATPGRDVLVAWNGSREAARAVHQALPFLAAAERVTLCAVGEEASGTLDDAVAMLRRHDVRASPARALGIDRHAGEVLLAEAGARDADLLVAGAYGHARLRELVFGGATRHLLTTADLPVLFGG